MELRGDEREEEVKKITEERASERGREEKGTKNKIGKKECAMKRKGGG